MPLDRRVRDARMLVTLAELKVLAAKQFSRAKSAPDNGGSLYRMAHFAENAGEGFWSFRETPKPE